MNRDCYRLVFNRERGVWMAAAEWTRGRGKGGRSAARRGAAVAAAAVLLAAPLAHGRAGVAVPSATALPVASTNITRSFVYSGAGSTSTTGANMVINQTTRTLGLNWDSFNIGSDASVTFVQPDGTSRVLNRIWDANPSVIMGRLSANGQIYLVNQNGILFGNGAQVNVGGLVASALGVPESLLENGLPRNSGESLKLSWEGDATGFGKGFVALDPGATIVTPTGGPVVLLAPRTAENLGRIEMGGGSEAILAAGGSVLLTAPADPNLRGLLIEVQPWKGQDAFGNNVTLNGVVTNKADGSVNAAGQPNGVIASDNGVVSLAALAVNQQGVVSASKAVNLNGEIMLISGSQDTQRLTVTQTGNKAEIDWQSGFNIAQGQTVEFIQSTAGAVAYNFVHDADRTAADGSALDQAGRSTIDGVLKASGQLFLINEKGIDFGANARVTASNFVASALGLNPNLVADGLFSQVYDASNAPRAFYLTKNPWKAATAGEFAAVRDAALAMFRQATVNVVSGATITTAQNGFAILAGGQVSQGGTITTPGGQTILAAGADLYLKPPYSQALRGFTAEVNPLNVVQDWDASRREAISRGADANRVTNTGTITASFGNITLVGNEITQAGTLATSTSVTSNGSIRLLARDQVVAKEPVAGDEVDPFVRKIDVNTGQIVTAGATGTGTLENEYLVVGQIGGTLTLAAGSRTEVALDGSDGRKATSAQAFQASSIEGAAAKINIEGNVGGAAGAQLVAKGGSVSLTALESFVGLTNAFPQDPAVPSQSATAPAAAGIFVGAGARIDVAGATAKKSVADLFIEVELRGDEFADNPVQRSGPLRGQKAWVDIRDKVAIADLTGYFKNVGLTLEEKAASGGTVALRSLGSVIVKRDAVIDVSGGRVDFAAGEVRESRVQTGRGGVYRLNDAPANVAYPNLSTVTRQERAYTEGKSAGSVELSGHSLALDGTLIGGTVRGERQRNLGDPATDRYALPKGAKLIVRDGGQHYQPVDATAAAQAAAYGQAQIAFVAGSAATAGALGFGDSAGPRLELSQSLVDAGFSRFNITSDGRIDIPADVALSLAPGGEFTAAGRQLNVAGDITAPGGSISLTTLDLSLSNAVAPFPTEARYSTLVLENGATLNTAGRWVNDLLVANPADYALKVVHGGSITLTSAHDLDVKAGAALDVSGGARLYRSGGKDTIEAGKAGSIKLTTGGIESEADISKQNFAKPAPDVRRDASLFLDGSLSAYALGKGGALEIATSAIRFGQAFGQDSRAWTRDQRLAADQVGAAFDAGFLARGGFFDFKFTGRDGVTVGDSVTLAPNPASWSLDGVRGYQQQATGASIASFARSLPLHPDRRAAPTTLTLATRSTLYGDLLIDANAHLKVDPLGSINLESRRQLTVLGTLEAPGGKISVINDIAAGDLFEYSVGLQSRSIYLGPNSRLLAAGTTKLSAATRRLLDLGQSAASLFASGNYKGQVLAGGSVELDAGLGYLITRPGSLIDVAGATGTFSIAQASDRGFLYRQTDVGSGGGRVAFSARDGFFLNGDFLAAGGIGAPGGVFSSRFGNAIASNWNLLNTHLDYASTTSPRTLTLFQSTDTPADNWPAGVSENDYLAGTATLDPALFNGKARLDLTPLAAGGFGSWYLQSAEKINFEGTINAWVANQLRLDGGAFAAAAGADVSLHAAAIQIGAYSSGSTTAPTLGAAKFVAEARDLALFGNFSWSGFGDSTFTSRGELHFDGLPSGKMTGTGQVDFSAARVSPATFSNFTVDFSSADPAGRIDITRPANAEALGPLLSAGGRLEFKANEIVHRGRIEAPLGEIVFTAPPDVKNPDGTVTPGGSVTLGTESVTSVAASGLLPLGATTESGGKWVFLGSELSVPPQKLVRVDAANSTVEQGATINLSGGGEAVAWEFTPGPGGKTDVLAPIEGKDPTTFAILPGWSGNFAPADSHNQAAYDVSNPRKIGSSSAYTTDAIPSLKPGDQIQLGENPTGYTGLFTLLPARYALLPGAVLVTVKPTQDATVAAPVSQADGSWLVGGSKLAANLLPDGHGGYTAGYSAYSQTSLTFELASRDVVLDRAKYIETTATRRYFDTPGVQLPGDAGRLAVAGRTKLSFDPVLLGQRAASESGDGRSRAGRGMELDLAAPKIEVVEAGNAGSGSGWATFTKDQLNGFDVSSLLLGGQRSVTGDTTTIDTVATDVRIATAGATADPALARAADALQAQEVLLAARETVSIETGSLVAANGDAPAQNFVVGGDGAFARIAGGAQATLTRTGVSANPADGDFILASGATVSGRALILDATHVNDLAGLVKLDNAGQAATSGGALAIGAPRINIVGDGTTPADGLTLDNLDFAGFGSPDQLRLTSYKTLDFYGPAVLGSAGLKELIIAGNGAAGIAGHGAAGTTAKISAGDVRFENLNPTTATFSPGGGAALGAGTLEVAAQTVTFGGNATQAMRDSEAAGFAFRGFNEVKLTAAQELRFAGIGVTDVTNTKVINTTDVTKNIDGTDVAAKLTVDAGRVVASSGADHLIRASGTAEIKGGLNKTSVADLGGRLDLRADSVDVSGRIVAPAGSIALTATGAGKDVTIKDGAVVAADGATVAFADTLAHAPGGRISLKSTSGNVAVNAGALVSVSGAPGGDAGRLAMLAKAGTVSVAANTLRGAVSSDSPELRGGDLSVDADTVNVNDLAAAVREPVAGKDPTIHFTGQWDIRRRSGDLVLNDTVTAQRVSFAADNGNIRIGDGTIAGAGKIDASGPKGGEIELFARNGEVKLTATGQLLAKATDKIDSTTNAGTRGRGGRVTLGASGINGKVVAATGSVIDVGVAPGSVAQGGEVVFRAGYTTPTTIKTDLNIQLAGTIQGASDVSAEFVSDYTGASLIAGNTSGTTLGLSTIKTDLTSQYSLSTPEVIGNVDQMRTHLGFGTSPLYHVRAGVDIASSSTADFTIGVTATDLDFSSLRFGSQVEAGALTVRALGDLKINGSISDGFANATRDAALNSTGDAWRYRLVAGADTAAANPLAVLAAVAASDATTKGSIVVASGKFVRTGVGDIAMAARRDIKLLDKASVFTAGREDTVDPANFAVSNPIVAGAQFKKSFPTGGGDVKLLAGERIVMTKATTATATETAPDKRYVEWLLRASSSTVNTQWGPRIGSFQQGFAAFGGGDIQLLAGTDIKNITVAIPTSGRVPGLPGQVDLAKIEGGGDLMARAGGSIDGGLFYAETGRLRLEAGKDVKGDTAIALGNTTATVIAAGAVALGSVSNPMSVKAVYVNSAGTAVNPSAAFTPLIGTYGADSELKLVALSGNVALNGTDTYSSFSRVSPDSMLRLMPSRVRIAALNGDIGIGASGGLVQAPGANGQLDLLAKGSINLAGSGSIGIQQLDVPANYLPSVGAPKSSVTDFPTALNGRLPASKQHASAPWHQNDSEPSRLLALTGNVTGSRLITSRFAEAVRIEAGGNIEDVNLSIQHARPDDVSRIRAGGDIRFYTGLNSAGIQVGGPGRLEVTADGSIDLGTSAGIVSRGNLDNFYLPEGGANLFLLAGASPDYAGFRAFLGVGADVGEDVLRDRFFGLLRDKGREALAGGGEASYEAGRAVIRALFPAASITGGDIDLAYSQVKTEQGGTIDFLVPGGGITVGIANPDQNLIKLHKAADQGLFTVRSGDIRALVRDDFLVNQSRVFTLGGGNILVWSDRGNIDAGGGAKTVSATPPPVLVIRNGQIVLDTSASVSGSGIGTLASQIDTPASDLDLFAPQGAIDAGDAGLRSTGNVNLGARVILNASNIQAAGAVAGAPVVVAPAAVAVTPASPVAAQSADATSAGVAGNREASQGILTVEVLDTGEADAAPADSGEADDEEKRKKLKGKAGVS